MAFDELTVEPVAAAGGKKASMPSFRDSTADLLRLALPMIVSRAGLATMAIADSVMVSRFSPAGFASLSLADGTLGRIADVFAAFIMGGLVLVPRAFGAGNSLDALKIWRRSIPPSIALGLIGALLGLAGTRIFLWLGQPATLAESAGRLTPVLGVGYVAALLAISAAVYLEGIRRPTIVAASVIGANLLNLLLNWFLIGGHAGFQALGARGSAISTTVVRIALAVTLVTSAWMVTPQTSASPQAANDSQFADQYKLGLSAATVQGLMMLLTASLLVFAGWLGPLALAILSAVWNLNAPAMLIGIGLADATGIRVASADGRTSNYSETGRPVKAILANAVIVTAIIMAIFSAIWLVFPRSLASIFTSYLPMLDALTPLIPVAGLLILLDSLSLVAVSALRALRDILWPTSIEIGSMAALVPLAAWLAFGMAQGVRGLLLAAVASAACRVLLLMFRFLWLTQSTESTSLP